MVLWSDETKINRIGSDGKVYMWKTRGEPYLITPLHLLSSMEGRITSWYGVV